MDEDIGKVFAMFSVIGENSSKVNKEDGSLNMQTKEDEHAGMNLNLNEDNIIVGNILK